MTSRVRIKQRLLGLFLVVLCSGFISLGGAILFGEEVSGMSILTGTMFLWIGVGFLLLTLNNMKTIRIQGDNLSVGTHFGLVKKHYTFEDIIAINPKSFRNKWKSYPGLLLKFRDERQIHIHEMEFKNFREIKKVITDRVDKYDKLEIEIWTPLTIRFLVFGGLIIAGFMVLKIIEL
jgi:hypothetical protein